MLYLIRVAKITYIKKYTKVAVNKRRARPQFILNGVLKSPPQGFWEQRPIESYHNSQGVLLADAKWLL